MQYFVDCKAAPGGDGSKALPFRTISGAAAIARPGDEVLVLPGIYREWVSPANAGTQEARITYRSAEPRAAVITGAEPVTGWVPVQGHPGCWQARVPNSLFTGRNPYTTKVSGDWFNAYFPAHLGEVYLNDRALYEVTDPEGVYAPVPSAISWNPEDSLLTWTASQDAASDETVLLCNFGAADPNRESVEINVREACFYPKAEGVGYITLSGFKVCRAACQWAPPTAYQEGMIGPHWSRGWIIEDCEIFDAKCSGISLGKYLQPENDNKWLKTKFKDGTQTERECICQAQAEGWTKERIGSHVVRGCDIHDCGQTGIVGHLGGVFSLIEGNHIHHINNRQNLAGAEIGGIKMHAAIDVIIRGNVFNHCTRGLWLDWQAQGTRVTGNLFFDNTLPHDHLLCREALVGIGEDIFIEISHGPTLVDHNVLLSDRALKLPTQGVAVCHNLIAGSVTAVGRGVNNNSILQPSPRYTPYHMPHRTEVAGFMTILHGDMRFYNNIFAGRAPRAGWADVTLPPEEEEWNDLNLTPGTFPYDDYPTREEWERQFEGYCGMGSEKSDRYYNPLPVWTGGNVYLGTARPCKKEKDWAADERLPQISLREEGGRFILTTDLYGYLPKAATHIVSTETLAPAFEPEQAFENPDGTPIVMDRDLAGEARGTSPVPGPVERFTGEIVFG